MIAKRTLFHVALAAVVVFGVSPAARAQAITDLVVVAVDGAETVLTMDEVEALPQTEIVTETPWHDGVQVFTGPTFVALWDALGLGGTEILGVALNGYQEAIPVSDFTEGHPILATRRNGERMPVRDKGPYFVVYPYSDETYRQAPYLSRSVWQLNRIIVQ